MVVMIGSTWPSSLMVPSLPSLKAFASVSLSNAPLKLYMFSTISLYLPNNTLISTLLFKNYSKKKKTFLKTFSPPLDLYSILYILP
jgi:hypothetical protein